MKRGGKIKKGEKLSGAGKGGGGGGGGGGGAIGRKKEGGKKDLLIFSQMEKLESAALSSSLVFVAWMGEFRGTVIE